MTEPLRAALGHLLTLSRAHAAARDGDLREAARLLDELDATVPVLDLRARVHAQLGELAEADACWARVLSLAPDHEGAAAGRATIARIQAGSRARPLVTAGRVATAAVAAVVLASAAGIIWMTTSRGVESDDGIRAGFRAAVQRADALQQRLAALDADRQAVTDRQARALNVISDRLAMPGVRVERRAADVRLVFEAGLFRANTELTPQAGPLLTEVGRRLAGLPGSTTVVGHAVAVPGGPSSGGSTVALARAQVAARHLADGGGLPLTAFTLATADQSAGPFPDPPRNRTVTLLITPTA